MIRVAPDLTFSNPTGAGAGFGWNLFWVREQFTRDKTNGINNAVSCCRAVQFSALLLCYCLPVFDKICRTAMNFVFFAHTCITRTPVLWDLLRGSIGLMHGRYRSPAVCAARSLIVGLMNCCHATLAIILLSPSVSDTVHSVEIIYFFKFLTLRNSSYHWSYHKATPSCGI